MLKELIRRMNMLAVQRSKLLEEIIVNLLYPEHALIILVFILRKFLEASRGLGNE